MPSAPLRFELPPPRNLAARGFARSRSRPRSGSHWSRTPHHLVGRNRIRRHCSQSKALQTPWPSEPFADFLCRAADPRTTAYAIDLPDTGQELMITDRTGEEIGEREGQEVILTATQWPRPCCDGGSESEPVKLTVRALSEEVSVGLVAEAESTANMN